VLREPNHSLKFYQGRNEQDMVQEAIVFACRQPDRVLQQIDHIYSSTMTSKDAFKQYADTDTGAASSVLSR